LEEREIAEKEILEEEERKRRRKKESKKEELEIKAPEKIKRKAEEIPLKKEEGYLIVPLIKLEKISELELKKLEVSKEIPQIEKRRKTISIPIIKLQEPSPIFKKYELDYRLPYIEKRKKLLTIPIIRVYQIPKASILLTEFNTEIRRPAKITLPKIRVPIYQKAISISPKFLLESFDLIISKQLIQHLEGKEEAKEEKPIEKVKATEPMVPSVRAEDEEIPDFLEFAFGSGGGKIRSRGPKIILFKDLEDDSYISFLENICLRVYQEREGGEPKAIKIYKIEDDMNKRKVEEWLEADGKIFTIDIEKEKDKILDETYLWEKLEETYSERLGFIIFTTKKEKIFEYLRGLLRRINCKAQGRLNIVELEVRRLPLRLIELSSGMIDVDKIPKIIQSFDYIFNEALFKEGSYFNKILEDIKNEEKGLFKESTNPAKKVESFLHFNIKVFLVRYLVHKLRKEGKELSTREEIMKEIETEKELSEGVFPDVKVGKEVYEVETLFGPHAGEEPDLKITRTIGKYNKIDIDKVNIVMDNFGFLLHLKELLRKKKHFNNVEFYTLDLKNKKLISISDFVKELKRCLEF
jgi:hypothetical protein